MPLYKNLDKICYKENSTIRDVLEGFNSTVIYTENKGFGLIVNSDDQCVGVVSDGDIRHKLVKGVQLDSAISEIMNTEFVYVESGDSYYNILKQFDKKVTNIPVLDKDKKIVDLYQYSKYFAYTESETKIIRAKVPVRISFSGGGTDMSDFIERESSAVLSSTINKFCTASVLVRDDDEIHISSKDLNIEYSASSLEQIEYGDRLDLIKAAIKMMKPKFGFNLETFAEYEVGTGLGGSSALVISVLGVLNYFRNEQQLDLYQLAEVAYQVERINMDIRGGWQDQYATCFGGFSWIEFKKSGIIVNPISLHKNIINELEYNLMLFRMGESRSSSSIQKGHIENIINNNSKFEVMKEMKEKSEKMKKALLIGEIKKFGDLLHECWELKKKINIKVTNKFIDECYNTARNLGALGGKLLGAGDSGYMLIYASPLYQMQIKKALEEKGALQERIKFNQTGLEVWSTKR